MLGSYQSDFARNLARESLDTSDLTREVVEGTLAAAGVEPEQIESIHVGNAFGQLYTGQGHLGAMPATVVPELWGVPAMRHALRGLPAGSRRAVVRSLKARRRP